MAFEPPQIASFPRPLTDYPVADHSLFQTLASRVEIEPVNS